MTHPNATCDPPMAAIATPRFGAKFEFSVRVWNSDTDLGGQVGLVFWYNSR